MGVDPVDIRAFGPLRVRRAERPLQVGGRTGRAVLCALALTPDQPVGIDRLSRLVWGDSAPGSPDHALHTHVTRLRRALGGGVIFTDHHGYHLAIGADAIDIQRFETSARRGDDCFRRSDHAAAAAAYAMALAESGHREPLPDLQRSTAGRAERARLQELQLEVEERRAASALLAGQPIMSDLEGLAIAEPLRELRWALLMWAQVTAGRQAAALRSYRRAAEALCDVGLSPGTRLRTLENRILHQDPTLERPALVADLIEGAM